MYPGDLYGLVEVCGITGIETLIRDRGGLFQCAELASQERIVTLGLFSGGRAPIRPGRCRAKNQIDGVAETPYWINI